MGASRSYLCQQVLFETDLRLFFAAPPPPLYLYVQWHSQMKERSWFIVQLSINFLSLNDAVTLLHDPKVNIDKALDGHRSEPVGSWPAT